MVSYEGGDERVTGALGGGGGGRGVGGGGRGGAIRVDGKGVGVKCIVNAGT